MNYYSFNLPSHNIALLFLYAISSRFLLFDYKITGLLWQKLLLWTKEQFELSTKKTQSSNANLIVYTTNEKPNIYWFGLYKTLEKLLACPFCKGCWSGYLVYLLFIFNPNDLNLDLREIMDFAMFSWSCGLLSYLSAQKLGI